MNNYIDYFKLFTLTPSFSPKTFNTSSKSYPTTIYKSGNTLGYICNNTFWAGDAINTYHTEKSGLVLVNFTDIFYQFGYLRFMLFSGTTNTIVNLRCPPNGVWYRGPAPLSGYSARKIRLSG